MLKIEKNLKIYQISKKTDNNIIKKYLLYLKSWKKNL